MKKYGWIYQAELVADFERVTLDEVMAFPLRRFLNDLIYITNKNIFLNEQLKFS